MISANNENGEYLPERAEPVAPLLDGPAPLPWERQKNETPLAFKAFTVYRDLGEIRSCPLVAQKLARGTRSLKDWSQRHKWRARARAWDDRLDELTRESSVAQIIEMNKRHARQARALQTEALKRLHKQKVGIGQLAARDLVGLFVQAVSIERAALGDPMEAANKLEIKVSYADPETWRGTTVIAHGNGAGAAVASNGCAGGPLALQSAGVRPAVGQDDAGPDSGDPGSRPAGDE